MEMRERESVGERKGKGKGIRQCGPTCLVWFVRFVHWCFCFNLIVLLLFLYFLLLLLLDSLSSFSLSTLYTLARSNQAQLLNCNWTLHSTFIVTSQFLILVPYREIHYTHNVGLGLRRKGHNHNSTQRKPHATLNIFFFIY